MSSKDSATDPRSTSLRALAVLLGLPCCTVVTDPWQYTEVSLHQGLERYHPGCGACVETQCKDLYDQCAAVPECVNYVSCLGEAPSPARRFTCLGLYQIPSYMRLVNECVGCSDACRFGSNWDCVGRHAFESTGSTSITWSQRLLDNDFLGGRVPLAGVTVRACRSPAYECGPSRSETPDPAVEGALLRSTSTDSEGWFTLELPVEPGSAGFEGILVASGATIPTFRLQHTSPRVSARSETELLSNGTLELVYAAGIPRSSENEANILFQMVDCLDLPALGVTAVPLNGTARGVYYAAGTRGEFPIEPHTTPDGRAVGGLFGLDVGNGAVTLEFRLGDRVMNKVGVPLVAGEISVLQVGPATSGQL